MTVAADGSRVAFLRSAELSSASGTRSDQLWVYDVAAGTATAVADTARLSGGGPVDSYATDGCTTTAVLAASGCLHQVDLVTGATTPLPTSATAGDPRPDPTGSWVGYLSDGCLRVRPLHAVPDDDGAAPGDLLLAGEPDRADGGLPHLSWGDRGWWWSPDGRRVLATRLDAGHPDRQVSLHLLELDGGWVDVHWDRETYPHLASAGWADHGSPVVAVLRRSQQHGLVLAVDPRTGETQVHAELADPRWVEPVPGTPRHLPDGRVLVGGELAHDGYDARCLFADGTLLTPPGLYVRRVVGRLPGGSGILVEGTAGEPSEQHLYQVGTAVGVAGADPRRVTTSPGWHRAEVGGDTVVIGSESLERPGVHWTVWCGGDRVGELPSAPPPPPATPRPELQRVTDRGLPTGVLYPDAHVRGRRLPVLVDTCGLEQGVRASHAAWRERWWWATQGFAVVAIDHRGSPGVAPSFEKVVHRRVADVALADLVEALLTLAGKHTDLDLDKVAVTGRGLGGWLAALAALRHPGTFRCAVAEAPLVEWEAAERTFATRYLGPAEEAPDVYRHHSLLTAAAEPAAGLPARPLLLVPDHAADGPVQRLAAALRTAGRPHRVLPAHGYRSGIRPAARDFLRRHLG